jgi:ribosomal protein S18 acetylase RimI-like enzyme
MMITIDTCIRDFGAADTEPVRQLIYETIEISYGSVYPQQAINFFKGFHSAARIMERHQKGKTIVIERSGRIIGTGSFLEGEIMGVFVHPDFQSYGLGKKIMTELEKIAFSNHCRKVSLSVSLPSRGFYEGLGYNILKKCFIEVKTGARLDYWTASKEVTAFIDKNNSA